MKIVEQRIRDVPETSPDSGMVVEASQAIPGISDVFGMLKRTGSHRVSIDEMNDVIADGWAGKR